MKFHHRGIIACVVALLACQGSLAGSTDDDAKVAANKELVPADLKVWTIRFDGFAGTPHDRSWFRVTLKHDGTIIVQKKRVRRGDFRTVLEKKLDPNEVKQFFRTAAGIINEYKEDKSIGDTHDGWNLTLEITAESFKKSVKYQDQWDPAEGPPGFDVLSKIINRNLKNERFPE